MNLISINIINKDNKILNKNGYPIILYATDVQATLADLTDTTTQIGQSMMDFFIDYIMEPTILNKDIDNYLGCTLCYIYYNIDSDATLSKNSIHQKTLSIPELFPLSLPELHQLDLYYAMESVPESDVN